MEMLANVTGLIDDFVRHLDIDTKEHDAYIDASMYYTPDSTDMNTFMTMEKTMAVISTGELDVVVGDEDTLDYFVRIDNQPKEGLCASIVAGLG